MPDKMAPGRPRPTAAIRGVTSSAGECGVKDQVSRSRPTKCPPPGARHLSLVGATATGKTAAAVRYARRHADVELVSVDAIAVYRGSTSARPSRPPRERRGVTWHLVDCCDPSEEFSVARFQAAARAAIDGIEGRRHRAVLVGGTGLYHRSLVDDLVFPGRYRTSRRRWKLRPTARPGSPGCGHGSPGSTRPPCPASRRRTAAA